MFVQFKIQIANYYVAAGMKTVGISAAGGVGQGVAETIVNGYSQYDLYELEMSRFLGLHNNRRFLRDRVREVPGMFFFLESNILIILINIKLFNINLFNHKNTINLYVDDLISRQTLQPPVSKQ